MTSFGSTSNDDRATRGLLERHDTIDSSRVDLVQRGALAVLHEAIRWYVSCQRYKSGLVLVVVLVLYIAVVAVTTALDSDADTGNLAARSRVRHLGTAAGGKDKHGQKAQRQGGGSHGGWSGGMERVRNGRTSKQEEEDREEGSGQRCDWLLPKQELQ
jgi:hypothetical protein